MSTTVRCDYKGCAETTTDPYEWGNAISFRFPGPSFVFCPTHGKEIYTRMETWLCRIRDHGFRPPVGVGQEKP